MSTSPVASSDTPAFDSPRSIRDYHSYLQREVLGLPAVDVCVGKGASDHAIVDGWKAIGLVLGTLGITGGLSIADKLHLDIFKFDATSNGINFLKWAAILAGGYNLWSWATNPQKDLETLRTWLVTPTQKHNLNNNHRLTIITQIFLVCSICFTALFHPLYFGIAGALTYAINFIGFFVVMSRVDHAVKQAKQACDDYAPAIARPFLQQGIQCIEQWWGVGDAERGLLSNRLQRRHLILIALFLTVAVFGVVGNNNGQNWQTWLAYIIGIVALVYAVVSISLLRSKREDELDGIDAKWSEAVHRQTYKRAPAR
ncbi:MAG: hypothetical protein KF715_03370 [Candidatus Didemnitutus sp.]|nr:hypothetical protein [Candidatus Didemnitutus sp.]